MVVVVGCVFVCVWWGGVGSGGVGWWGWGWGWWWCGVGGWCVCVWGGGGGTFGYTCKCFDAQHEPADTTQPLSEGRRFLLFRCLLTRPGLLEGEELVGEKLGDEVTSNAADDACN